MGRGVGSQHKGYCDPMECLDLQLDEEVMSTKVVWEFHFHSLSPLPLSIMYRYNNIIQMCIQKEPYFSNSCHLHSVSCLARLLPWYTISPSPFLASKQEQQEKYYTASLICIMVFFLTDLSSSLSLLSGQPASEVGL